MNNLHSWLVSPSTQSWRKNQTSRKTPLQTYSSGEEIFLGRRAFWVTKNSRASYERKERICETGKGGGSRLNGGFCSKYESTVSVFPNRDQHWGGGWKKGPFVHFEYKVELLDCPFSSCLHVCCRRIRNTLTPLRFSCKENTSKSLSEALSKYLNG